MVDSGRLCSVEFVTILSPNQNNCLKWSDHMQNIKFCFQRLILGILVVFCITSLQVCGGKEVDKENVTQFLTTSVLPTKTAPIPTFTPTSTPLPPQKEKENSSENFIDKSVAATVEAFRRNDSVQRTVEAILALTPSPVLPIIPSTLTPTPSPTPTSEVPQARSGQPEDRINVVNLVKKAVVVVRTNSKLGSGFLYTKEGHIFTNAHVVSGVEEVEVITSEGLLLSGKVEGIDEEVDLAMISVENLPSDIPYLKFATSVEVGEEVWLMGYPLPGTLYETTEFMATKGIVSSASLDELTTDAVANSGNSGGPLVNNKGEVVGIIKSKLVRDDIEGIGYAISLDRLKIEIPIIEGKIVKAFTPTPIGYTWDWPDGGSSTRVWPTFPPTPTSTPTPTPRFLTIEGSQFGKLSVKRHYY